MVSLSTKPHRVVGVFLVWTTDFNYMIVDYEPLKHVVDVLICDDRQCGVQVSTKLSRIIPTQHWTVRVETILLIIHWIALGDGRYDINGVEQNQNASCKAFEFLFTVESRNYVNICSLTVTCCFHHFHNLHSFSISTAAWCRIRGSIQSNRNLFILFCMRTQTWTWVNLIEPNQTKRNQTHN